VISTTLAVLVLVALAGLAVGAAALAGQRLRRAFHDGTRRSARRLVRRFRVRINRFQLTRKWLLRQELVEDPEIQEAARRHAQASGVSLQAAIDRASEYLDEIIPSFSIIAYYRWGHRAARAALNALYRVRALAGNGGVLGSIPPGGQVVLVMNHRSNADYVVVAYVLADQVAVSYAVGEWARVWPLDHLFHWFGSYFVRRGYRESLYHKVLERYVQRLTREGVTQGIFLEGGLTRDGRLSNPKIGVLDYITGTLRDACFARDIIFVPVGINYDRVVEDRSLLREAAGEAGRVGRVTQLRETLGFLLKGAHKYSRGRLRRYGYAGVGFGQPLSLREFLERVGPGLLFLSPEERKPHLKLLAATLLERVGKAIPVTPVPFVAALLLESWPEPVSRGQIAERAARLTQHLVAHGARWIEADGDLEERVEEGLRLLMMRRAVVETGAGLSLVPSERGLLEYYRNSIIQFGI
jgi:glycerol-3-phosphate O-acyltransferase